jgi:hypothetical protein
MLCTGSEYDSKPIDYKKYRAEKFEKTKQKINMILRGINSLSLKSEDKAKLIAEVKKIVADF